MSTEKDVLEFNDSLYSQYVGEPHDIQSHRKPKEKSWNRPSIIIDCLVILLVGLLGSIVVESGILSSPPRVEALDVPLIPPMSTLDLPTVPLAQPPIVDSPNATVADERVTRSMQRKPIAAKPVNKSKVERVISYALAQRGKPYVWGASGPRAFDCSGLVMMSYKQIGISLPHYTGKMIRYGTKVSRANLIRGDLVFPTSSHVGIYLGGNKMVVASSGSGRIIVQTVYSFYTARRLL